MIGALFEGRVLWVIDSAVLTKDCVVAAVYLVRLFLEALFLI
jgi:hypothetical protein